MALFQEHLQDGTLSVLEKVDILFKRDKSKVAVDTARPFQNETLDTRPAVLTDQIWSEALSAQAPLDIFLLDPDTAIDDYGNPLSGSLYGRTSAINDSIRRYVKVPLKHVEGANDLAYYLPISDSPPGFTPGGRSPFQDLIPFNYDPNGTYNIQLYKNNISQDQIPVGETGGHWIINHEYATITFFNYEQITGVDKDNPPLISYYQYIGEKGVSAPSESFTKEFNGGDGSCGDGARALCIDTVRGALGTLLGENDCSYALQWGPDGTCGSWRILVVGNGDGTTSLHFQYRTNTLNDWKTKMHIDPAECDTTC